MNIVEGMPFVVLFTVISGLYFPTAALAGIWAINLGRIIYVIGYVKEPKSRIVGGIIHSLATLMIMILSIASAAMLYFAN